MQLTNALLHGLCVCPGFSNANCLKALTELGYLVGVGDNTW